MVGHSRTRRGGTAVPQRGYRGTAFLMQTYPPPQPRLNRLPHLPASTSVNTRVNTRHHPTVHLRPPPLHPGHTTPHGRHPSPTSFLTHRPSPPVQPRSAQRLLDSKPSKLLSTPWTRPTGHPGRSPSSRVLGAVPGDSLPPDIPSGWAVTAGERVCVTRGVGVFPTTGRGSAVSQVAVVAVCGRARGRVARGLLVGVPRVAGDAGEGFLSRS